MEDRLKICGILHKLNLTTWEELRKVADDALNIGIYSPSLVDAALDEEENILDIGLAFTKALAELNITIPESINKCRQLLLSNYISEIATRKIFPYEGLLNIMKVYYGWEKNDPSHPYVEDYHSIIDFIACYWGYSDIQETFCLSLEEKKEATIDLEKQLIKIAKNWQ